MPCPPDSDTVQLHQHHRCSSQSRASNTLAVQNGGCFERTYCAERVVIEFLTEQTFKRLYVEDAIGVSSVRRWVLRFKRGEMDIGERTP